MAEDGAPGATSTRGAGTSRAAPVFRWYPPTMGLDAYVPKAFPVSEVPRPIKTVDHNIPQKNVALKAGAKAVAADGESVGRVERVFVRSESRQGVVSA